MQNAGLSYAVNYSGTSAITARYVTRNAEKGKALMGALTANGYAYGFTVSNTYGTVITVDVPMTMVPDAFTAAWVATIRPAYQGESTATGPKCDHCGNVHTSKSEPTIGDVLGPCAAAYFAVAAE